MKKEFIPYNLVLELKELGFDEPCFGYWNIDPQLKTPAFNMVKPFEHEWCLPAPIFSQVFRFFREKHNMLACIYSNASGFLFEYHDTKGGTHRYDSDFTGPNDGGCWDSYEEAEIACLEKLIEIVKT